MALNSFNALSRLRVHGKTYEIYRLDSLQKRGFTIEKLPYSIRILLESLLRHEDGLTVTADDIETLARWSPRGVVGCEIAFTPARVLLQDFTGVPAVVDLAAMREAMHTLGGDPKKINPLLPAELVIDHSVQVDAFGTTEAFQINADLEFQRNQERYAFLKWGQRAFQNFNVVPPDTGIVHQVNLEYLARVVFSTDENVASDAKVMPQAYPDTLVGTDSHTTMVNGLGVLGWGVGGIEAEANMLGQPMSMLIPQVVGFRLEGRLREGATATDLVLTVTQMLRERGVVEKFVEFYGPGLAGLPLADRATIANMAPEYGATCGYFPIDAETLRYLKLTGRSEERLALVEAYAKEQGLFYSDRSPEPEYSDTLSLDLTTVEPSVAGPKRPQDRVPLSRSKEDFLHALELILHPDGPANPQKQVTRWEGEGGNPTTPGAEGSDGAAVVDPPVDPQEDNLRHGSIVIAAITSCTNTSNPSVMVAAGLVARKAVQLGLSVKPWVKTSLAPGSKVVTEYLTQANLIEPLQKLRFNVVGYGCTTCIGNSGPLPAEITAEVEKQGLVVCSVLSGNRNFEGRINSDVRANYLMSPPLVVAYALAGRMDIDLQNEPLGYPGGKPVYLRDIWPTQREVDDLVRSSIRSEMFARSYGEVFQGDERWNSLDVVQGDLYTWPDSTYVKRPPYFEGMSREAPSNVEDISGVRALAVLGNSVTTDHISPAGSIRPSSPAGKYLIDHGADPKLSGESYGARRGNHEVMVRGTFANVRLRNLMAPGTEGGVTAYLPTGEVMPIFEASTRYQKSGTPLLILAGKEYGSGSSRDWAAKGPRLLGVRVVIAESYERIHRSNLVGMGLLPLQFNAEESVQSLGLTGREVFDFDGLAEGFATNFASGRTVKVRATREDGTYLEFSAKVRIDTEQETLYYLHGGILQYVLRQLLTSASKQTANEPVSAKA